MARSGWQNWKPRERERTGIKTSEDQIQPVYLVIHLEVTNSFKDLVPDNYVRKQTLTNAERYITQELKELEDMILGAEDRLYALEYESVLQMSVIKLAQEVVRIQKTAKAVAALDVFASLALVAEQK